MSLTQAPYFIEAGYGGISLDRLDISNLSLERRLALYIQAADAVVADHEGRCGRGLARPGRQLRHEQLPL